MRKILMINLDKIQKDISKKKNCLVKISDYCGIIQKEKSPEYTLIAFSAMNTEKGKFRFSHALKEFKGNIIFLNTMNNDWYVNGIDGVGNNLEESIENLKIIINCISGNDSKLMTLGGSMGGYGALVYGTLLNADYSLISGVEYILKLPFSRSNGIHNTVSTVKLKNWLDKSTCEHHLFIGTEDTIDMVSYTYLSDFKSISCYPIINQKHEVIEYIHDKYNILQIVENLFLTGRLNIQEKMHQRQDNRIYISNYVDKILDMILPVAMQDNITEEEVLPILRNLLLLKKYNLILLFITKIKVMRHDSLLIFGQAYYHKKDYDLAEKYLLSAKPNNKRQWQIQLIEKLINNIKNQNYI